VPVPDPGIAGLIDEAVASGGVPGAVAVVGRGAATLASFVAGQADTTPGSERLMTAGTVFDVASLTKAVATTTAALALAGAGKLALEDPACDYAPVSWPASVTVRHLLTHTAGLPDSRKFYEWCEARDQVLRELYRVQLEAPPGTRVRYSDPGFMVLGEIVAAVAGEPLDTAVRRLVTGPLGMNSTGFNPSGPAERFAATEPRADGISWTGVVHDENARAMGGMAGHAGLFSTAADLARFARWWVSAEDGPVPVALRRVATTCQTAGLGGCRGLGWVCPGDRHDILGGLWPATAVSHTGFTGTSLALDPVCGLWVVLLTNSVHFGRDATAVKALRRTVHAAASTALLGRPRS
jgi:CubicO group peptidase (beta-lactamase class C family)